MSKLELRILAFSLACILFGVVLAGVSFYEALVYGGLL